MSRQRKQRGRIFNIFKDNFRITFYHKPSMLEDDVYHIIILDDVVKLKIKIIHDTLVIDDVTPVTSTYIPATYNNIVKTLIQQQESTVLLAITGNITGIQSACINAGAPIVEDPRFTCLPPKLYDELKEHYKDDKSKYGFYLLAVNEHSRSSVENSNREKIINPGDIPIVEQIESKIKAAFPKFDGIFLKEGSWENGKQCNFNGIQFQMVFNKPSNEIQLKNFYLNEMESFQDLVELCELLETFGDIVDIILYDVSDPLLYNICDTKGYQNISSNLATPVVPVNRKYFQVTYGSYKIHSNTIGGLLCNK